MAWDDRKCNKCNNTRATLIRALAEEAEANDAAKAAGEDRALILNRLYKLVEDIYGEEAIEEARRLYDDWGE